MDGRIDDFIGSRFGRLVALERLAPVKGNGRARFRCDCGTEAVLGTSRVRTGKTKSCGCLRREVCGRNARRHGHSHGRTYRSWSSMIQRCTNPKVEAFAKYGAKGIMVCDRWMSSFDAFLEDMGERPERTTIDRIDNEKGYEPSNCRWATYLEQTHNRRGRYGRGAAQELTEQV